MSKGESFAAVGAGTFLGWVFIILIGLGMYGCPKYQVWQQRLAGEAELARAEANRKIAVAEAEAKKESAKALAEAEVIRSEGVARSNEIVANGLGGPEGYLRYLWIQGMQTNNMQVVYVPTEAGLPLLEAGRFRQNQREANIENQHH